ncbi:cellulase [Lichenihabitans sp. PAMC28606]|uniref:glycosyl hydrolase family 8 n=1 Tax=Lichenihabitans sp. PAMC28606 TaxID=2880932 RepID=UPI001D0AD8FB|nr:glycosyl hydrolase family 8 [Lichenihabitans sp. PAMC28606]UDL93065.1 cellulase [Lichenihabitans sp. PAMC28606]
MNKRLTVASLVVAALVAGFPALAQTATPNPVGVSPMPAPHPTPAGALLDPAIWQTYKARFISPEGRLIDDANGDISHSEGQGYAMLLAAFAGDDLSFSRIWGWTVRELYRRPDGLASWRWSPTSTPHVTDGNNATDGDLLIAWGLAEAARKWDSPEYKAAAHSIAVAAIRHGSFKGRFGLTLLPGASGFGPNDMKDGPVVNPSYWVFPAFNSLKAVAPEINWAGLTESGVALLNASRFAPTGLPSDWISLKGPEPVPAASFPPTFGYNGIRIPLYLVWGDAGGTAALTPFLSAWSATSSGMPAVVDVVTARVTEPFYDQGYEAVAALTACAVKGTAIPIPLKTVKLEHYYSTTLHLLAMVAARQRSLPCDW